MKKMRKKAIKTDSSSFSIEEINKVYEQLGIEHSGEHSRLSPQDQSFKRATLFKYAKMTCSNTY